MPQDVIGKDRTGEGGYGETVGAVGNAAVDDKSAPKPTETQEAFDRISTVKSDEVSKPSKEIGSVISRYYDDRANQTTDKFIKSVFKEGRPTVAQENMVKLGFNARAGDKQALDYLAKIASESSGLLNEYSGVTDNASFAQWILKDLQLAPEDDIQKYIDNEGGLDAR
jgi:hypothetical protein